MKITHKTHGWTPGRPVDPEWAERVEREAEQHTARTEAAWRKAKRRLERAIKKAEAAQVGETWGRAKEIAALWRIVAQRREELKAIERMANQTSAGSEHRGKGSYRGVTRGDAW